MFQELLFGQLGIATSHLLSVVAVVSQYPLYICIVERLPGN